MLCKIFMSRLVWLSSLEAHNVALPQDCARCHTLRKMLYMYSVQVISNCFQDNCVLRKIEIVIEANSQQGNGRRLLANITEVHQ